MNRSNFMSISNLKDVFNSNKVNHLVIANQNIRSLRCNFDRLVSEISVCERLPDLIILTEIWISNSEVNFYQINDYSLVTSCNDSSRGKGVAVYCHKKMIKINNVSTENFNTADVLRIDFEAINYKFNILIIYRYHKFGKLHFIDELKLYLESNQLIKSSRNCIIAGDININLLADDNITDKFKLCLASNGFNSLINKPTRITDTGGSCLDHMFIRTKDINLDMIGAEVVDAQITDHCMTVIWLQSQLKEERNSKYLNPRINYYKLNYLLERQDWSDIFCSSDTNNAYDLFIVTLCELIEKSKVLHIKKTKVTKLKCWITDLICNKINKRNQLYKKCKLHPHNIKLYNCYVKYRNNLNFEIRQIKNDYYKRLFKDCAGDVKKTWSIINNVIGSNSKKMNQICV